MQRLFYLIVGWFSLIMGIALILVIVDKSDLVFALIAISLIIMGNRMQSLSIEKKWSFIENECSLIQNKLQEILKRLPEKPGRTSIPTTNKVVPKSNIISIENGSYRKIANIPASIANRQ